MTFTASDLIRPAEARDLKLVPFFRVHDSRYMIYWRAVAPSDYSEGRGPARSRRDEAGWLSSTRTLDRVTPGEQQPEVEHNVQGEGATTGVDERPNMARSQRLVRLRADNPIGDRRDARKSLALRVTYSDGQRDRLFDIVVNDRVIASVSLDGPASGPIHRCHLSDSSRLVALPPTVCWP